MVCEYVCVYTHNTATSVCTCLGRIMPPDTSLNGLSYNTAPMSSGGDSALISTSACFHQLGELQVRMINKQQPL